MARDLLEHAESEPSEGVLRRVKERLGARARPQEALPMLTTRLTLLAALVGALTVAPVAAQPTPPVDDLLADLEDFDDDDQGTPEDIGTLDGVDDLDEDGHLDVDCAGAVGHLLPEAANTVGRMVGLMAGPVGGIGGLVGGETAAPIWRRAADCKAHARGALAIPVLDPKSAPPAGTKAYQLEDTPPSQAELDEAYEALQAAMATRNPAAQQAALRRLRRLQQERARLLGR